ncbi:chorismate--pyruvate lyase family protein [Halotalea alkalilenta]|uniref:Probable chorismate pyruvate-lyase n=1 Tax=Halotalea alkalilenta TaxID=376489 RepID=A0A172YHV3_9GAMM|nr:chorismate lyase [Halotalea alkalilenta]ANF58824.1 hypothetical protein A5892_16270 [Halotalea alkalilenta]
MPVISPAWRSTAFRLDRTSRTWLFLPGALTEALRALGTFSLEPLSERRERLGMDEAWALGVRPGGPAWIREVLMRLDGVPCVAARSVTPLPASRGVWRSLRGRGSRPLGESLYGDPAIRRDAFTWCRPTPSDFLGVLIARCEGDDPACDRTIVPLRAPLARRSRFLRKGEPLLVAECFLSGFWSGFAVGAAVPRLTPRWSLAERRFAGQRRTV